MKQYHIGLDCYGSIPSGYPGLFSLPAGSVTNVDGIIDKQGGEGLEMHCTYTCIYTLTVIGMFLQCNFYSTVQVTLDYSSYVIISMDA